MDDEYGMLRAGILLLSVCVLLLVLGLAWKAVSGGTQIDPEKARQIKDRRRGATTPAPSVPAPAPETPPADDANATPEPAPPADPATVAPDPREGLIEGLRRISQPKPQGDPAAPDANPETAPPGPPQPFGTPVPPKDEEKDPAPAPEPAGAPH